MKRIFILITTELFFSNLYSQSPNQLPLQPEFIYGTCLSEVSFSGNSNSNTDYITISKDEGGGDYIAPHFKLSHPVGCQFGNFGTVLERKPAAYVSGTKAKIQAIFETNCTTPIIIRGRGINDASGYNLPNQIVYPLMGKYIYETREFNQQFMTLEVRHLEHFTIVWEFSKDINSPSNWIEIEQSDNTLFITHGPPLIDINHPIYHSVFYTACKYANNLNTEESIIAGINNHFMSRSVESYSGTILAYWKPPNFTDYHSTAELLFHKSGVCAAWGEFFQDCGRVHGILVDYYQVFPPEITNPEIEAINQHIKNDFGNQIIFRNESKLAAKNWNITQEYLYLGEGINENDLINSDAGGMQGVPAQGTEHYNYEPRSIFEGHGINKYNNKYYDPSYGTGPHNNEIEFEFNSVDIIQGYLFGDPSHSPIKWYIYVYKLNTSNQDLKYQN